MKELSNISVKKTLNLTLINSSSIPQILLKGKNAII